MRKRLIFLTLFFSFSAAAQVPQHVQHHADSLLRALNLQTADTAKAKIFFQLSDHWSLYDSAKGVNYAKDALRLRLNKYFTGVANFYLGGAYFDYDNKKAEDAYAKAIDILEDIQTNESLLYQSRAWANRGAIMQRAEKNKEYLQILLEHAIPLAAKARDSARMARQYTDVGLPFMNFGDFDKAIFYFQKAVSILKRHKPGSVTLADGYLNIAQCYLSLDKDGVAKLNLDSAGQILAVLPDGIVHAAYLKLRALYFTHMQDWHQAKNSLDDALKILQSIRSPRDEVAVLYGYVALYRAQKNYVNEREALTRLNEQSAYLTSKDKAGIWFDLARVNQKLGKFSTAYDWLLKHKTLNDSINLAQTNLQLNELETKYNFLEKENQLIRLTQRNDRQQLFLVLAAALLILTGIIFYILFKYRKRKAVQEMQSLQQKQKIEVTEALLNGEERERRRLAQDLHDGLGGMLANVKIKVSALSPDDKTDHKKIISQIDDSVTELRRIAHNLMPGALLRSGLETALRDLCDAADSGKANVEFQALNISSSLTETVQITVYRIVQELLANVIKHAGATEVFVQCSQSGELFFITIEDNGRGFNRQRQGKTTGIGLQNIKTRVDFLNGKMDTNTSESGTIINIELQCNK